jgi:hypothetical protein
LEVDGKFRRRQRRGKAIENIRIYQGGAGPWRRDFEGGFVLVNPLSQPHTFSAADLAGALSRTGITRIKASRRSISTTASPVTGPLTLGPFDAIILLADRMRLNPPVINGVVPRCHSLKPPISAHICTRQATV